MSLAISYSAVAVPWDPLFATSFKSPKKASKTGGLQFPKARETRPCRTQRRYRRRAFSIQLKIGPARQPRGWRLKPFVDLCPPGLCHIGPSRQQRGPFGACGSAINSWVIRIVSWSSIRRHSWRPWRRTSRDCSVRAGQRAQAPSVGVTGRVYDAACKCGHDARPDRGAPVLR